MAVAFQVAATGQKTLTTGTTFTIALTTTAGDMVLVAIAQATGASAVSNVQDTNGNVYHRVGSLTHTVVVELWKTDSTTPLATGGTITVTVVTGFRADGCAASYRGVAYAGEAAATNSATSGTFSSGARTLRETLGTGEVVTAGGSAGNNAFTVSTGNLRQQGVGTTAVRSLLMDSQGNGSPVTNSATMTSSAWSAVSVELRPIAVTDTVTLTAGLSIQWPQFRFTDALTLGDGSPAKSFRQELNVQCAEFGGLWTDGTPASIIEDYLLAIGCPHLNNWLDVAVEVLGLNALISDNLNNWLDVVSEVLGGAGGALTLVVSDSLNNWLDALAIGYGDLVSDQNNLSDSLLAGYGAGISDQLVILDSNSIGYGFLLSDQWNTWLDLVQTFLAGTVLSLTLSDNLNNWLDFVAVGYGAAVSGQLVILDSSSTGYGFLLSDNLSNWLDVLSKVLGLNELTTDSLSLLDTMALGYGDLFTDQIVLSDGTSATTNSWLLTIICPHLNSWLDVTSIVLPSGFTLTVSDNLSNWLDGTPATTNSWLLTIICPHLNSWLDAVSEAFVSGGLSLTVSDNLSNWLDVLMVGYGALNSDQLIIVDSLSSGYGAMLSDSESANWLDSVSRSMTMSLILSDNLNNWLDFLLVGFGAGTSDQLVLVDSLSSGYGFLLLDSESANWLDVLLKGLGSNLFLTDAWNGWLDFMMAGFGAATSDQLVIVDSLSSGYGNLLSDAWNTWLDSVSFLFQASLVLSDNLSNWLDFLLVGYGSATSDQIVLTDSASVGYGLLLSDNLSNWLDLVTNVIGMLETLSDSESANWLDFMAAGFGAATSDQLVLVDSLSSGYGALLSDNLNNWLDSVTLSVVLVLLVSDSWNSWLDFMAAGFGMLNSDQLVIVDSTSTGYGFLLSDNINSWLDNVKLVGQSNLLLSDSWNSWLDFVAAGYGAVTSDQLVIVDSTSTGYGFLLSDNLNSWLDNVIVNSGQPLIQLSVSDNLNNWLAFLLIGYGNSISDQLVLVDSLSSGYGFLLSDSWNSWLDALSIGYGNLVSDSLILSDQLLAGYGSLTSDQMVLVDSLSSGYGLLLSDNLNSWLDLVSTFLAGTILALTLSDSLNNWLDSVLAGFGAATSDQLVILDSFSTGYGLLLSDNLSNWLDALRVGYGDLISDQLTFADQLLAGYGSATSDQMILVDSLSSGYGALLSDSQTFVDQLMLGYGNLLSDAWNSWLDSVSLISGLLLSLLDTENANWADALRLGYGLLVADTESGNWADVLVINAGQPLIQLTVSDNLNNWLDFLMIGYGALNSDQLVIVDSLSSGYGALLSDSMNNWLDLVQKVMGLLEIISDSESASWSDFLQAGIGTQFSDQLVLTDSASSGYGLLLSDNLNNWLDLVQTLIGLLIAVSDTDSANWLDSLRAGFGMATSDQLVILDSASTGYGLLLSDNLNSWLDAVVVSLLGSGILTLTLSDNLNNWSDALLAGYGAATSDQIILLDSLSSGYGSLLSDSMNSWLDVLLKQLVGFLTKVLSDTESANWLDTKLIGYGDLVSDSFTLTDSTSAGYGSATSDQMILVDSLSSGYGALISDSLNNWLEALAVGYGDAVTDSFPVHLDFVAAGYGAATSDQMVLVDSASAGYGLVLSDQWNTWLDLLQFQVLSPGAFVLVLSDAWNSWTDSLRLGYGNLYNDDMVLSDFLGAGFGSATSDNMVLVDSFSMGYGLLLNDQLFSWSEALVLLEAGFLQLVDALQVQDQLRIGYGLSPSDVSLLQDSLNVGYGLVIVDDGIVWRDLVVLVGGTQESLVLSDDLNSWLDALAIRESDNRGPAKYFRLETVPKSQFDRIIIGLKAQLLAVDAEPIGGFTQLRVDQKARYENLKVERKSLFYLDQSSIPHPAMFVGDTMSYWQDQLTGALL